MVIAGDERTSGKGSGGEEAGKRADEGVGVVEEEGGALEGSEAYHALPRPRAHPQPCPAPR
eukprot:2165914-Rhodomonas_salina.1